MTNRGFLKGIRCPECGYESTFIVHTAMNVVMQDDGNASMSCSQPADDYFPDHVIPDDIGFRDTDPIECFERWGGCGHRGTVKEFRTG